MSITTKTGDNGTTSLINGKRVSKNSPVICAIGELDELGAVIGLAKIELSLEGNHEENVRLLERIQQELFTIGAELMRFNGNSGATVSPVENLVKLLETEITQIESRLPPLRSFILSGDSRASAQLHHARTVCRRAERAVVAVLESEKNSAVIPSPLLPYFNRLSDLLFLLARE